MEGEPKKSGWRRRRVWFDGMRFGNGSPMGVGEQARVARPHRCDAGPAVAGVERVFERVV